MHSAPSVTYPVGRSYLAGALLLLIWLGAGAAIGMWWAEAARPGWRLASGALLWVAAGCWTAARWWHSPAGTLAWDGESWNWSAGGVGESGRLEVSLDLQRSMLVRWAGGRVSHWFWLERASRVERWDDLRRAVYSRRPAGAPPDPGAPAMKP